MSIIYHMFTLYITYYNTLLIYSTLHTCAILYSNYLYNIMSTTIHYVEYTRNSLLIMHIYFYIGK